MLRKLAASLLLVLVMPFLAGASGQSLTPCIQADASADFLSRTSFIDAHAALPGIATPSVVAELGAAGSWRTPPRTPRVHSDAHPSLRQGGSRTRIERLGLSYIEHRDASFRARTNTPVSYGNPPPASLT